MAPDTGDASCQGRRHGSPNVRGRGSAVTTPVLTQRTTIEERSRTRGRYAGIGLLGLLLLTVTMLIFLGLVLTTVPDEAGFIVPPTVVIVVVTVLAWRFDATWVRVLGAVAPVAFGLMMFWVAFGLAHPGSFFDFVPAVTFLLGTLLALGGNIAAIVRRRDLSARSTIERRIQGLTVAFVAAAVVVSGTLAIMGRETVDPALASGATPVDMYNFEFVPTIIEVRADAQLVVHNSDAFVHDFTVPDLELAVTVNPGNDALLDVRAAPGSYVVYCTLHSDTGDTDPEEGMVARLVVR
jgi:hypothetical protein